MADESKPTLIPVSGGTFSMGSVKLTPEEIKAHGSIRTQVGALILMGVICSILAIGGIVVTIMSPSVSDKVWSAIAPIILAAVSGTVGFLAGEKSAQKN
jgi:hypothetical protein